ncbi:MAG: GNAT family N-acetyltransferase [Paracoccaceae bacterium]
MSYFLYLYSTVGGPYEWTDWLGAKPEEQQEFVHNPNVSLYTLLVDGWPGGFFMLDSSEPGTCDLAYFGLMPQAIGRGLGGWFLGAAIDTGWDRPGTDRMTVNTCTLDHPRALGLYQKMGFRPVGREHKTRNLTRARTITG